MTTLARHIRHALYRDGLTPTATMASLLLAGAAALPAQAQQDTAQATNTVFEEVVVTARKRAESMYDVPISINVLSETAIDNMGAKDFSDLLGTVPSLTAYQNGPGRTRLSIRGVANGGGNDNDTQNQETVAIYLDEIPISMGAMNPEISLFDLQRVEVLRGPQGTLYGAGSMTGTIRQVTNKPDLAEFGGKFETSLSTIHKGSVGQSYKGLVNVPVIEDTLAVRASAYYVEEGGYIDNILTGEDDLNEATSKGGRVVARWQASDRLIADLSLLHHEYSDGGRPEDLDHTPELTRDYPSFDGYDDEMDIYNLTLDYDLGWAQLVSSTSYFDRTVVNRRSLDLLLISEFPMVTPHELEDTTDSEAYVQEIRLASTYDSPLQWTVGAYADKKDVFYENTFPVPGADAAMGIDSGDFGAPTDNLYYGYDDLTIKTYALFGEAYYNWDKWTLTAGLRYFNWKQEIEYYQSGLLNGGANSDPRPEGKEDGVNPKVNLSYDLGDNSLVYVQAARGFRYGGINGNIPRSVCADELDDVARSGGDTRFFDPDKLWNYEIGTKGATAGGRLQYNLTYFYIDWEDMQTQRSFECGFGFRENVGKATSEGVEVELTARPIDGLTLTVGGTYVDSQLAEDVPNLDADKGDPAPFVADLSLNGSVEYRRPVGNGLDGFIWANAIYTGDRGTEFSKDQPNYRAMDDYTVANLRLGVQSAQWEVSLFADNLFDSRGVTRALRRPPFDPDAEIRVQPRTLGVTGRVYF
ncbi:TonB-dependent receptor [Parahaliea mediterranea]|uniref:TonB-dependent receptor n=1 Tax=Parahaliea mediterranea TaxID=651086 RepID=A0A939ILL8_9GAMM|nr:TonB-dependent receptor [Parahaliea mediterranea]MBN7796113.1 TonB-dependent receptor [Parahaliea mediterranea]